MEGWGAPIARGRFFVLEQAATSPAPAAAAAAMNARREITRPP